MTFKQAPRKTSLTFEEQVTAAFMHYVRGISQQDIAMLMGGVNMARVNDACQAIRRACEPGTMADIDKMLRDAREISDG
jgi:hypothetical protein